jgi:A/G-specific adenine glycosylase
MPWKGEKDPYKIWLSEIILQQTREEQGLKYYQNFISKYPDVHLLANAPEEEVFKLWEGLGYYSRCKNLLHSAKYISNELNGIFPDQHSDILKLKGVGSYTAAAIASFAYNQHYAVLDGNVFRVLSRISDVEIPIDSSEGKKAFSKLAQDLLPQNKAGIYNQAIMDFGAVICKPVPLCSECFFNQNCKAYLHGHQDLLPVKEKKLKIKKRWLNYFVIRYKDQVMIRQRTEKDIWQQLFEFLLIETNENIPVNKIFSLLKQQYGINESIIINRFEYDQKLTHQYIRFSFIQLEVSKKTSIPGFIWAKTKNVHAYAFPKTLKQYIVTQLL